MEKSPLFLSSKIHFLLYFFLHSICVIKLNSLTFKTFNISISSSNFFHFIIFYEPSYIYNFNVSFLQGNEKKYFNTSLKKKEKLYDKLSEIKLIP